MAFEGIVTLPAMADAAAAAAVPPVPSNPDQDEGGAILGAVITVTSLAFITVLTRFYVRTFMIRNLGWDVSNYSLGFPRLK